MDLVIFGPISTGKTTLAHHIKRACESQGLKATMYAKPKTAAPPFDDRGVLITIGEAPGASVVFIRRRGTQKSAKCKISIDRLTPNVLEVTWPWLDCTPEESAEVYDQVADLVMRNLGAIP